MANKNLTPVASWDTPRSPINGDPDDQALDEDCHQRAANRSEYLWDRIEGSVSGVGVKRMQTVGTAAALKAITGMAADDVVFLRGEGFYFYVATAAYGNPGEPWRLDSDTTGYWYALPYRGMEDQLGDCIVIGDTATDKLLRPDLVPYRLVKEYSVEMEYAVGTMTLYDSYTTASFVASSNLTLSIPDVLTDDVLIARLNACWGISAAGDAYFQLYCGTAGDTGLNHAWRKFTTAASVGFTNPETLALVGRYVALSDATHIFRLKGRSDGAVTAQLAGPAVFTVSHIRP